MRLIRLGARAVLVEVDDAAAARSLAAWVREADLAAEEVVPAARTVLLDGLDPAITDTDRLRGLLAGWTPGAGEPDGELVEIAVRYDGPDLADVARHTGLAERDVVAAHTAAPWRVACVNPRWMPSNSARLLLAGSACSCPVYSCV